MPDEKPTSRNIPLPIQREVRKRCGFGCVVCGSPLYEYDHLLGWAEVQRHVADEITLLCDPHHRERGSGLLPTETVLKANAEPHNIRQGASAPYGLHYAGEQCEIVMGDSRFIAKDSGEGAAVIPLLIDGLAMIAFQVQDGHVLLHLNLFDEFNRLVLKIDANHLVYSVSPWDIQFVGRRIIVREAARQILIEVEFEPPGKVYLRRGRFLRNGAQVLVRPDVVLVGGTAAALGSNTFWNCPPVIVIGEKPADMSTVLWMQEVGRYSGDKAEAERWWREVSDADALVGR